jgi:PAT family acetyl-CoA transporter-like MFS transporter 1
MIFFSKGLTMLSKENASWSSTCESTGTSLGWFTGSVLFLVVESAEFSNKYIRSPLGLDDQITGIITIDNYMQFFGIVFLITTTLVWIFKREIDNNDEKDKQIDLSMIDSYKVAWSVLCLKPILKLALILFSTRLAFATESMSYLKLIEVGVSKETLGLLAVPLAPLQILLPFIISRKLNSSDPFKYYTQSFFLRYHKFHLLCKVQITLFYFPKFFVKKSRN